MLKKPEEIRTTSQLRSSNVRGLKSAMLEGHPEMEPYIDLLFPKQHSVIEAKLKAPHNNLSFTYVEKTIISIHCEDIMFPHLKLLHKFPFMLKKMQVDKGAIRFVIGGANVMAPGLVSAGGAIEEAKQGEIVAIMAEGKTHALAIGRMMKSTEEIRSNPTGAAIENLHYLNDGFWKMELPS
ncbi:unnamed protein product [Blepharisma stoltei]|uniref:PUA domain-containing protein n=1 Tax=Blepharisma stoltei TaxID=1481888 RepID=A0AAU9JPF3_9CILI|nr:unnamed protein product [Blepharisma stoltei]